MGGRVLGFLVFVVVAAWRATLRIRLVGEANREAIVARGRPVLYAIWHQRMVLGILKFPYTRMVTMASRSKDGDVIASFLGFWGFRAVRGSSSRGGKEALTEMIDALRGTTRWAALTPDGPRGPARRSKPGVWRLAEQLDAPILPVGTSCSRPKFLDSWDRYLVPLPFTRAVVVFGPPVERLPGESVEAFLARVDAAIDRETEEADRLCGVADAPRERLRR
ncbi:MAG TPA: lysophospholipid acyltransferase family protein [Thermoanaerobaculia bacterium]